MNRVHFFLATLIFGASSLFASPPPVLPWQSSDFTVPTSEGVVRFQAKFSQGALKELSAASGKRSATFPVSRLSKLGEIGACSGISTRSIIEEEGSEKDLGVELTFILSAEYNEEKLIVVFDLNEFEFSEAEHQLTPLDQKTEVKKVDLN